MTPKQAAEIFDTKLHSKEKIFLLSESTNFFHIYTEKSASGNMCLPFAFVKKSTGKLFLAHSKDEDCHSAIQENGYDPVSQKVLDEPVPESEYQ